MAKEFLCGSSAPVVSTRQGKLRGFRFDGLYHFFGIEYAQAERFQPPRPVAPWEGVKDALNYGYVCPLLEQPLADKELLVPHRYWLTDEHCLNLNVWTPSLDKEAKKPVMVWIHGGAFTSGSALEHVAYEGDHLSRDEDVVVVSVNHRLHMLGYLDVSSLDPRWKNSGNNGSADLIAALQWVHDNIASFGGDPDNVTLFGQSCGGTKITCLMNTPAADGLYHKVIIESGAIDMGHVDGDPAVICDALLAELNLTRAEASKLESIDMHTLGEAYKRAALKVSKKGSYYFGSWPQTGEWYRGEPRLVGFTDYAKTVPALIGSVMGEFCFETGVQDKYKLDETASMKLLEEKYGEHAGEIAAAFRKAYPDKHLTDALYVDQSFRGPLRDLIARRTADKCAPTYSYLFTYDFPIDGGKAAWHCSEVPFVFRNTDRAPQFNVPGETDELQDRVSGAWAQFARTGNPQISLLPEWKPCEPGIENTMLLDVHCRTAVNHDAELCEALAKTNTAIFIPLITSVVTDPDGPVIVH